MACSFYIDPDLTRCHKTAHPYLGPRIYEGCCRAQRIFNIKLAGGKLFRF